MNIDFGEFAEHSPFSICEVTWKLALQAAHAALEDNDLMYRLFMDAAFGHEAGHRLRESQSSNSGNLINLAQLKDELVLVARAAATYAALSDKDKETEVELKADGHDLPTQSIMGPELSSKLEFYLHERRN